MNETRKAALAAAGIDVEEALARFMENDELMMKFLLRFPQDPNFAQLKEAMACRDPEQAFAAAHTFKGVVGNLSMKRLFLLASAVVEDLRIGDLDAAAGKMAALEDQYLQISAALSALE